MAESVNDIIDRMRKLQNEKFQKVIVVMSSKKRDICWWWCSRFEEGSPVYILFSMRNHETTIYSTMCNALQELQHHTVIRGVKIAMPKLGCSIFRALAGG